MAKRSNQLKGHQKIYDNIFVVQYFVMTFGTLYEPPHDKTNKVTVRPAKTQISLGIRPVWSVFALRLMGN